MLAFDVCAVSLTVTPNLAGLSRVYMYIYYIIIFGDAFFLVALGIDRAVEMWSVILFFYLVCFRHFWILLYGKSHVL